MSNRVLLISGNFYPEPTGIGKYSGEMINWLAENGYDCTVITTFPYYPDWKVQEQYRKSRFWFKKETWQSQNVNSKPVTIIRCPLYIPTSPTGVKRLLSEFTITFFSYLVLFCLLFTRGFNFVMTVAPPFQLGLLGVLYKKIRRAQFIYHIQDLQIDAASELGMIKSSLIVNFLFSVEKYIISKADYVSTISEGMIRKIKNKYNKEIIYFPNWVNTDLFYPIANKAKAKLQYGFKPTDQIILYSGAIGEKQGLKSIVYLAKFFEQNENIKFVICGSGPYKWHLVKLKNTLGLENLIFMPLQPFKNFNSFLNMADIHLIIQKLNASDLMMPSKLSTILAVGGVAIVTANPGTGLYDIMNSSDMGFVIEPENEEALKHAIEVALTIDTSKKQANARIYAEYNLSIDKVLLRFAKNVLINAKIKGRSGLTRENVLLNYGQTANTIVK